MESEARLTATAARMSPTTSKTMVQENRRNLVFGAGDPEETFEADPFPTRTIITVMLSGPPRKLAKWTRKRQASSGERVVAIAPISSSETGPLKPSLQMR